MSETYLRVCVLEVDHDGDHLPYGKAPKKDEFGNVEIAHPRCVQVVSLADYEHAVTDRYRVVFEMLDPRMPAAGWHEVVRETPDYSSAVNQLDGLRRLEAEGDDVRNPRVERAAIGWEPVT